MPKNKQARVLACALCKQRRVKCSRSFPCLNCCRAGVTCVPSVVKKRRQRFAERELIDRIHQYETLLRQNHIVFEPLYTAPETRDNTPIFQPSRQTENGDSDKVGNNYDGDYDSSSVASSPSIYESPHPHVRDIVLSYDHLLFGAPSAVTAISSRHPSHVHIFKLWQIYLTNVHPLLHVTHTPSLQPRIIDAAADLSDVQPPLQALLFSVYCIAVMSLDDDQCRVSFQQSRQAMLTNLQTACHEALLQCTPWRVNDMDAATAMHLYLLSLAAQADPRSLAGMGAVALRTAKRMGMHFEPTLGKCPQHYKIPSLCSPILTVSLDDEMRRRLWWSMVLFDHRLCEISGQEKSTSLTSEWDCHPPHNVGDFELRCPTTKGLVKDDLDATSGSDNTSTTGVDIIPQTPTEAIFSVVRSELADFVRHTNFHRIMTGVGVHPEPKTWKTRTSGGSLGAPGSSTSELSALETMIETKYLANCNEEVPLHFMTIWSARGFLARSRLLEHYLTSAAAIRTLAATTSSTLPTPDVQRRITCGYALRILECDTKLRNNLAIRGFLWLVESWSSPVMAYFHVLHGLAKRPDADYADSAWSAICANYEALANGPKHLRTRLMFALKFSRIAVEAWDARVSSRSRRKLAEPGESVPQLVADAKANVGRLNQMAQEVQIQRKETAEQQNFLDLSQNRQEPNITSADINLETPIHSLSFQSTQTWEPSEMQPKLLQCMFSDNSVPKPVLGTPGFPSVPVFTPVLDGAHVDGGMSQFWTEEALRWI